MKNFPHSQILFLCILMIVGGVIVIQLTQKQTLPAPQPEPKKLAQPLPTIVTEKTYRLTGKIAYNPDGDACTEEIADTSKIEGLELEALSPAENTEDVSLGTAAVNADGTFAIEFSGDDFSSGVFSIHVKQPERLVFVSDLIGVGVMPETCHNSVLSSFRSPYALKDLQVL